MGEAIITADELLAMPELGRCELIRGKVVRLISPGADHGRVAFNVGLLVGNFVRDHGIGTCFAAETGFLLARDPDTVRAPDFSFVRSERGVIPRRGHFRGAPDLAVEVLSPSDRPGYVRDKTAEWLESGARAVWNVDPETRAVTVHEAGAKPVRIEHGGTLDGGAVLPGFTLPLSAIFD